MTASVHPFSTARLAAASAMAPSLPFDPADEPAFYVPPAKAYLPRPGLLAAMFAAVLAIVLAAVAGIYMLVAGSETAASLGLDWPSDRAEAGEVSPRDAAVAIPVQQVEYLDVSEETARQINAKVPFVDEAYPAATPLSLTMTPLARARAVDCLAAAVWYEAGDDALGQESVAQVVVNRMRHPSYPNTVCGVVFQGSQRTTGCQFTFTCDGAMVRRRPSAAAWARAQAVAATSLGGFVFGQVGWATHYHTDWVVPNWSKNVDKLTQVRTHLFFRWRGRPGSPAAFRQPYAGSEPEIALMRPLSPAHAGTLVLDEAPETNAVGSAGDLAASAVAAPAAAPADLRGNSLASASSGSGVYVVQVRPDAFSGSLALMANDMCEGSSQACTVIGYVGKPAKVTGGELGRVRWGGATPDFYYLSDRSRSREVVYWNCSVFPRPDTAQCLPPDFRANG